MTRAVFSPVDIAIIGVYFLATLIVGFWRRSRTTEDFLIASRNLGIPVFVATLVATWYGGILAVGEYTYAAGIANWTTQALPYYVFAVLFALVLAPRVRVAKLYTIPDKLQQAYDRKTSLLGAVLTFVMISPAPYILMVGQLVSLILGWPLPVSLLVGTVFSMAYVYVGGFESDVRINLLQFCLMFAGFLVVVPLLIATYGGFDWLRANLPPTHLQLDGGQDRTYLLVWFFIALWTFVDPGFHQRCSAAKSPRVAQIGILVAVACWALFDFLTTTTGLYARAILPDIPLADQPLAFPLLAEKALPQAVKGLFYVAMLATVMSTVVSYTFMAGMTVGRDLLLPLLGRNTQVSQERYIRFGILIATMLGIGICIAVPSVVKQWYAIGTICVPGLLFPVLAAYLSRCNVKGTVAFVAMLAGAGTAFSCLCAGWLRHGIYADSGQFPLGLQPMYPGLAASVLVMLAGKLFAPGESRNLPDRSEGEQQSVR